LTGLLFGDEGEPTIFSQSDVSEISAKGAVELSPPQVEGVEEQPLTNGLPLQEESVSLSSDALSGFFGEGGHFGGDLEDEPMPKSSDDVPGPQQHGKAPEEELALSDEKETSDKNKSLKKAEPVIRLNAERKEKTISQADTMLRHFKSNDW
jgi:hypothetical protein